MTGAASPSSIPFAAGPNLGTAFADKHNKGFPLFAYLMGSSPRTAHLRRFPSVSMRLLLLLQYEIQDLENRLLKLDPKESDTRERETSSSAMDFRCLKGSPEQVKILSELKLKCKEYEEAMLRFRSLAASGQDEYLIRELQLWLNRPEYCDQLLSGIDESIWGSPEEPDNYMPDLIQLFPSAPEGLFARLFKGPVIRFLHRTILYRCQGPDTYYTTDTLDAVVSVISVVITSSIIYLAIGILLTAQSRLNQLLTVFLVTAATTFCTGVFGNEKFTVAIATLAAVLVTLVANNRSSKGQ
ncbi:hypothetical protein K469DRAFT_568977 [Zopfia rhizophila CBS 207.26]|uniref:DUF6594 domain-containing protein n=1 Tax=Zopfia rhizophila CBS 207.26 TaxID=1314779 RepID=A0A6A6EA39_9PEZI|nr:hypothetical protein K469DRAFT_568977 [Zopfia rhizophila CBS 207.26]